MADLEFREAYDAVFDENGAIKACGRGKCVRLISECRKRRPGRNFGTDDGWMNVRAIKSLRKEMKL